MESLKKVKDEVVSFFTKHRVQIKEMVLIAGLVMLGASLKK